MSGTLGDKIYREGNAVFAACERLRLRGLLSFHPVIESGKRINKTTKTSLFLLIDRALKEVSISIE